MANNESSIDPSLENQTKFKKRMENDILFECSFTKLLIIDRVYVEMIFFVL